MTIHFNFRRYIKYIIIFLLAFVCMHSFTNVKAWSNLSDQYIVNYINEDNESLAKFLIKGDTDKLNSYLTQNNLATGFSGYYERVKNKVATDLGYSSFENFEQDYYYITDIWLSPSSSSTRYVQLSFFYCLKSSSNASLFNLSMATTVRSNSTPTVNANQTYYTQFGAIYRTNSYYFYQQFEHLDNTTFDSVTSGSFGQHVITCNSSSTYCQVVDYNSTDKTLSLEFKNADGRFLHYVDTNKSQLDLYFAKVNAMLTSNDYVFQKSILNDNSNTVYNLIEPIATNVLSRITIIPENIQQLSNNSLGITVNTIFNSLVGFGSNSSFGAWCSNDRPFVNKTCNIYYKDFVEQPIDADYINEVGFYFNKNEISLQGNYKVVSFRLYTPYNLQVLDSYYTTNTSGNDLLPFEVISQKVVDYSLYRDYVVVLKPHSSSQHSDQITSIRFTFSFLSDFVFVIPTDYSFGVYNTIKISSYNDTPTSTDIESEINNNPISSITNNDTGSFFSNFSINDHGLSQFVTLPLNYIITFKNSSCIPISLPFPHLSNITIPCMSTFISDRVPAVWNLYVVLINGFVIYRILISLLGDIKNIHKPDNDRIEVIDL